MLDNLFKVIFVSPARAKIVLVLLTTLSWLSSLHTNIFPVDTEWLVEKNFILHQSPVPLRTIWLDFSTQTRLILGAEYLPIRDISVWLQLQLFGHQWAWHHLFNLILYVLCVVLLYDVLLELFKEHIHSWFCTLIFALHTTHIESVVWLANHKDVLSLFFVLLSIRLFLKHPKGIVLCAPVGLIAYWSKNTAIVLPPLLFALSFITKSARPKSIKWWCQWIPIALCFSLGLWLTVLVGSKVSMFALQRAETAWGVFSITAQVWFDYLKMLIWPNELALFYVEPKPTPIYDPATAIGTGLIVAHIVLPFLLWKKSPLAAIGLIWIGLGLLPVSQITPIQNLMADRYLLLPSIGFSILTTLMFQPLFKNWRIVVPIAYCIGLSVLTNNRIPIWHNEASVWRDLIEKQPLEPRGWSSYAAMLVEQNNYSEAEKVIQRGFSHIPNDPLLAQTIGGIALRKGSFLDAEQSLKLSWKSDKDRRVAANNLCSLWQKQNRLDEARALAEELISYHPLYATGWNTLGSVSLDQNDLERAETALNKAHLLSPYATTPLINLGNLAYIQKDYKQAAHWWNKSLEINPDLSHPQKGLDAIKEMTE